MSSGPFDALVARRRSPDLAVSVDRRSLGSVRYRANSGETFGRAWWHGQETGHSAARAVPTTRCRLPLGKGRVRSIVKIG
jgi:hypothetical protein